jgi:ABC-type sugar transport system ATPase subunit
MNMSDSIIEMKGSLQKIKLENTLIQQIRNEIHTSFVNTQDIKMNEDLIRAICCAIENNVNDKKVDKLELFFKIYRVTFGETDAKDEHFI